MKKRQKTSEIDCKTIIKLKDRGYIEELGYNYDRICYKVERLYTENGYLSEMDLDKGILVFKDNNDDRAFVGISMLNLQLGEFDWFRDIVSEWSWWRKKKSEDNWHNEDVLNYLNTKYSS